MYEIMCPFLNGMGNEWGSGSVIWPERYSRSGLEFTGHAS